ncbi:hypothetical protein M0R45_035249 [Rubus argutus]|uniref:Leucine-rich repeat-containing N-terminal plant-type domain-containing protein n=1 Tax=Rubus argutus TaxID=59490 RepID=A0AAW1VWW1_RUBAR
MEGEALMDFKDGLGDSENRLSSWKGSNCCQWWGLNCSNTTGAVITVDLHNPHPLHPFENADYSGRTLLEVLLTENCTSGSPLPKPAVLAVGNQSVCLQTARMVGSA